jgi:hypothetical protein
MGMTEIAIQSLGDAAVACVLAGCREYLTKHNLTADPETLAACCRSWAKIKLPEALRDAKEAMACGMTQVAEQTFKATMVQAGIEAAKEAGVPA